MESLIQQELKRQKVNGDFVGDGGGVLLRSVVGVGDFLVVVGGGGGGDFVVGGNGGDFVVDVGVRDFVVGIGVGVFRCCWCRCCCWCWSCSWCCCCSQLPRNLLFSTPPHPAQQEYTRRTRKSLQY